MGVLDDSPPVPRVRPSKFMRFYGSLEEDDQAALRRMAHDPTFTVSEIYRRIKASFPGVIGRSSVERGLIELRESET